MRVIAGKARRAVLRSVPGLDTRPTTDRIKETLFNIINPELPGAVFLDLYCGSGGIGIEALSRDAKTAVFVDNSREAIDCVNENLEKTRLKDEAVVMKTNALSAIKKLDSGGMVFDIIYMDPPYKANEEKAVLDALADSKIISEDTLVIIEAEKKKDPNFVDDTGFEIIREKEYKTNKHFFIKMKSAERT